MSRGKRNSVAERERRSGRDVAVGKESRKVEGRERSNSDERKWENLGERKSKGVGQSLNLSQENRNES